MSSINTNLSAMGALQTLRAVSHKLDSTQEHVSSGLRVGKAADNAAYWSIATTMRSDNAAQSAVSDSIGLGQALLDTTYTALDQIHSSIDQMKSLMITASQFPGKTSTSDELDPSLQKIQETMGQLASGIATAAMSASFAGINLLVNPTDGGDISNKQVNLVTGYSGGKVSTTTLQLSDTALFNGDFNGGAGGVRGTLDVGVFIDTPTMGGGQTETTPFLMNYMSPSFDFSDPAPMEPGPNAKFLDTVEWLLAHSAGTSDYDREAGYNAVIDYLDGRAEAVSSTMVEIGSTKQKLDLQQQFTSSLMDAQKSGIGRLVDADMETESSTLAAQQVQQQLAIQSLSIANQMPQSLLSLFQG